MPSINPSIKIIDMQDKVLRTGLFADAAVRAAIAKAQGEIEKLPAEKRPEAQLDLAVQSEEAQIPFTIGYVIIQALTQPLKGDDDIAGSKKLDYFEWAIKVKRAMAIVPNPIVEFSNDEMETITARINRTYSAPLVVGQFMQAIVKDKPKTDD